MITKQMIAKGLVFGLIRLENSPNGDGIVAFCGDNWFYFGGQTAEEYSNPDTYRDEIPFDVLVDEIYDVLHEFQTSEHEKFSDEAAYYEAILNERLPKTEETSKEIFIEYVEENFDVGGEFIRLLDNCITYAFAQGTLDETRSILNYLLDGTIGLTKTEIETLLLDEPSENIIDATFVSVWAEGNVETPCKVNLATREVFDIEPAEVDETYEHLEKEHVVIDGVEYPVFQISDITEEDGEFWYDA